jgi:hypothetical protein
MARRNATASLGKVQVGNVMGLIAQSIDQHARLWFTQRGDANVADGGLELDQRMSVVVLVGWECLAVCTKVRVVTHSTLVANTLDVRQLVFVLAQRAIAVDAVMAGTTTMWLLQRIIDWHEAVPRMSSLRVLDAVGTVIPVRADQAFMADTVDKLECVS